MVKKRDDVNKELKSKFAMFMSELIDVSGKKGYKKFLFFLIMIDLTWFGSVVLDNLFGLSFQDYGEFAWTFLFAAALILMSDLKRIARMGVEGFDAENFSSLATFIIGIVALITAILSLPQIAVESPTMNATKGIIALIAIIYVFLDALILKKQ